MKKLLTLALGATMLLGAGMGVAQAQGAASGPFADVPTDHWAYQAVETLRDKGIVIGYPDGTYGGKRAMTRYEFAEAIARLLALIPAESKGPDMSLYALKTDIPAPVDLSPYAKTSDLQALSADLNNKLQQNQQALDALQALVNQFEPELKQLGTDVAAVQAQLAGMQARLAAVEAEQQRVRIEGDMSFIGRANVDTASNGSQPIDLDGARIGTAGNKSIFNTPDAYNDILLNVYGKVANNAQAVIKIDAGNYLPWLVSATSQDPGHGPGINAEPFAETFNIYEAYMTTPVSLGGLTGAEIKVGRFGTQFTKYTWMAVNPDSYASRPETNSGDIIGDGAALNFGVGGNVHLQTFAEKNVVQNFIVSADPTVPLNGVNRPGNLGTGGTTWAQNPIDQSAGARLTVGSPDNIVVGVSAVAARTPGVAAGTAGILGVDLNGLLPFFGKSGLTINAEGAVDSVGAGSQFGNVNSNKSNEAWDASLGYQWGAFNIKGGYQQVYENFDAPGYWGRVGSWTNPSNVEGAIVSASYAVSHSLKLIGTGNFYEGIQNNLGTTPLQKDDKLNDFKVGAQYGLTSQYSVDLGYEWAQWNLQDLTGAQNAAGIAPGKPLEQYVTIGLGHDFNKNASLKLLYQIINYNDEHTNFDSEGNSQGGVALGQLDVKF